MPEQAITEMGFRPFLTKEVTVIFHQAQNQKSWRNLRQRNRFRGPWPHLEAYEGLLRGGLHLGIEPNNVMNSLSIAIHKIFPEQTTPEIYVLYQLSYKPEGLDGLEPPTPSLEVK
jgi:hypothetical protein